MMRRLGLVCSATDRRLGRSEWGWWGAGWVFGLGEKSPANFSGAGHCVSAGKGHATLGVDFTAMVAFVASAARPPGGLASAIGTVFP